MTGGRQLKARIKAIGDTSQLLRGHPARDRRRGQGQVPRKTGFLGRTIVPGSVTDTVAIVYVNAPYAAAVEFGAKPHVIVPKQARVLAWPSAAGARRLSGRARKGTPVGRHDVRRQGQPPRDQGPAVRHAGCQEGHQGHGVDAIIKVWNEAGMTTTFRADLAAAMVSSLDVFIAANPAMLRRSELTRPPSVMGDLPLAFVDRGTRASTSTPRRWTGS